MGRRGLGAAPDAGVTMPCCSGSERGPANEALAEDILKEFCSKPAPPLRWMPIFERMLIPAWEAVVRFF
jgi:hypothetical protein